MMKQIFGHPKEPCLHIQELYCGICRRIPTLDTWDKGAGKIVGVEIQELIPISVMRPGEGGVQEAQTMMACEACLVKVKKRFEDSLLNILRPPRGDGGPGPEDGGAGVTKKK